MTTIDWIKIKNEYINTSTSYRKIAEKYGVSFNTLKDIAVKEKWKAQRDIKHNKIITTTQQKTAEKVVKKEVNRIEKILSLSDKIGDKIDKAIEKVESVYTDKIVDTGYVDTVKLRQICRV